jgi:hypothetical protein
VVVFVVDGRVFVDSIVVELVELAEIVVVVVVVQNLH